MSEHIYVGSGKEKIFGDGGSVINVSLEMDKIRQFWGQYGFTADSGKQYLKIKISKKREPDQYGKTHTVEIDTWKPNSSGNGDSF